MVGFQSDEVAVKSADLSLLSIRFYYGGQVKSTLDSPAKIKSLPSARPSLVDRRKELTFEGFMLD